MKDYIISVDFGGTKILSALLGPDYKILNKVKSPTDASKGADKLIKSIAESINTLIKESNVSLDEIKAICMGVPGTVNPFTGFIGSAPNIGLKDFNIKDALQKYFSVPVLIENDVNLAAVGIKKFEFENNVNNMLVVFVGTGIGGALIFNGQIYRGSSFFAGEIGHMLVDKDGKLSGENANTSFEKIASRTAIVESIRKEIEKGKDSVLSDFFKNNKRVKSKALLKALEGKDKVAVKQIDKASNVIGAVLGSIVTLLNIDTIVLGGGVIEAMGSYMLPKIEAGFEKAVLKEPGKIVKFTETKLGDDAALFGGYGMVEEFLKN